MAVDVDVTSAQNVAADLSACVDRVCGQDQRFASVVALGHAVWAELLTEDPDDKEHSAASVARAGALLEMLGRHVVASDLSEEAAQSIHAAIAVVCDPLGLAVGQGPRSDPESNEAPAGVYLSEEDFMHVYNLLQTAKDTLPSSSDDDSTRACLRAAMDFLREASQEPARPVNTEQRAD